MLEKIRQTLIANNINEKDLILLGVSGGPDSIAMLHALDQLGCKLCIAHLDHSLRKDSVSDSSAVKKIAKRMNIPFYESKVNIKDFADAEKLSIEEAARILRYRFLFDVAKEVNAQAVAVGHSADDQAETVLMHILRGSGLTGLRGIQAKSMSSWSLEIPLLRPILEIWRKDILKYCEENALETREDPSNLDTKYFRNKIRHDLIPTLQDYNPQIKEKLVNMSRVITEDYKVIDQLLETEWRKIALNIGQDCVSFSVDKFLAQSLSMKRLLIRKSISELGSGIKNIKFNDIDRAISFIESPSKSKRIDLVAGLKMEIIQEEALIFNADFEFNFDGYPQFLGIQKEMKIPGNSEIDSNWQINSKVIEFSQVLFNKAKKNQDPYLAYIDADNAGKNLLLRAYEKGDSFQPLGMNGRTMKLSDYFINQKIAYHLRGKWPLVCNNKNDIIWAFGQRVSDQFRITSETKRVLVLNGVKRS